MAKIVLIEEKIVYLVIAKLQVFNSATVTRVIWNSQYYPSDQLAVFSMQDNIHVITYFSTTSLFRP